MSITNNELAPAPANPLVPAVANMPAPYLMIDARGLSKSFSNLKHPALDDFTISVAQGQIVGLIGANGAGKSTALRIMATLVRPDKGDVYIAGQSVRQEAHLVRNLIGYMPDNYGLYREMKVDEYLDFFAACYGISGKKRARLVNELLELVELGNQRKTELRKLSRGMKQRLCLAHTLVHDPKVLLLDEPASGLDPRGRVELRELLKELSRMGKTIILTSHVLGEVQKICDVLGIMAQGKLVDYGPSEAVVNQIQNLQRRDVFLRVLTKVDLERAEAAANEYPSLMKESIRVDEKNLTLDAFLEGNDQTSADFLGYLTSAGIAIAQFGQSTARLEELFMRD